MGILDSDNDSDSDDEMCSYVPVPVAPTGKKLTAEDWAEYGKLQEAHQAEFNEKAAKAKAKREKRKKRDGDRKAIFGKLRASASTSDNKNLAISVRK